MSALHQIKSFVNHWLDAADEHSIHSPYFFDFYNQVIKSDNINYPSIEEIESLRQKLLNNRTQIPIQELGVKSNHFKKNIRSIADVAKTSLCPSNYCRLLVRMLRAQKATHVVELGTSMGITTLYLASQPSAHVITFEGDSSLINISLTHFELFEKTNIQLIEGNIDQTLVQFLQSPVKIDMVFMDANHRYEPTINYFNQLTRRMASNGIIVLDDIYYSPEMTEAWKELKNHKLIYGSIDLFRMGILFFDPALNKQHFTCSL